MLAGPAEIAMTQIIDTLTDVPMLRDKFPDLLDNYGYLFRVSDHVVTIDAARAAPLMYSMIL